MKKIINWCSDRFLFLFQIYWAIMAIGSTSFAVYSCNAIKHVSQEEKQYQAQQAEIQKLKAARLAFPCDTVTTTITQIDTLFITLAGDTVKGAGDTIYITRTRELIKYRDHTIIDRAAEKEKSDSIAGLQYQFDLMLQEQKAKYADLIKDYNKQQTSLNKANSDNAKLRPWKSGVIISSCSIVAVFGLGLFLKLKKYI